MVLKQPSNTHLADQVPWIAGRGGHFLNKAKNTTFPRVPLYYSLAAIRMHTRVIAPVMLTCFPRLREVLFTTHRGNIQNKICNGHHKKQKSLYYSKFWPNFFQLDEGPACTERPIQPEQLNIQSLQITFNYGNCVQIDYPYWSEKLAFGVAYF